MTSEITLFPYQRLFMAVVYLAFLVILIIQMIKILKNHHRICGIQNIIFVILFGWCFIRLIDNSVGVGILLVEPSRMNTINYMENYQYLISDIGDFVIILLFSFFIFYYSYLIYRFESPMMRNTVLLILIIVNLANFIAMLTFDIHLMKGDDSNFYLSYFFSSSVYIVLLILMIFVTVKIFNINIYGLDYYHPKPTNMGIASIIVCISIVAKTIYLIASGFCQSSPLSLICSEENPSSICTDQYGKVYYITGLIEILLFSSWEILPIATILILYWEIPTLKHQESVVSFDHLFSIKDESVSLINQPFQNYQSKPKEKLLK